MENKNIMSLGNGIIVLTSPLWIGPAIILFIWIFPFVFIARVFRALGKYNSEKQS